MLSTHSLDPCYWGESHHPACGPPASFSAHLASSPVSLAGLISSVTVIVRAGGAIWLNPFATVLVSVCSSVTVECCVLYPCCMGVFGMFAGM